MQFAEIFDKVESQGTPREVLSSRISVCFHSSMSSSSPSTGNSISDTQTGTSNSKVFLNSSCLFTGTLSELLLKVNQRNPNKQTNKKIE